MAGLLNRDIARKEAALDEIGDRAEETQIQDLLIAQLQREKAALRQALYEMALELAEARVAAAMQSLRATTDLSTRALDGFSEGLGERDDGE